MNKKLIKTIFVVLLYFCWFTFFKTPLNFFNLQLSDNMNNLYCFVLTFLFLLVLFLIYKKDLIDEFKKIDKSFIKSVFKNLLIIFAIMILSNVITFVILGKTTVMNVNNSTISLISEKNLLSVINLLVFIPIIEELVFKKSIRYVISNDIFFIVFSGAFLSSLYVILQTPNLYGIVSSLPYILTNLYLSYSYVKKENIYNNVFSKILYNFIIISIWWLL